MVYEREVCVHVCVRTVVSTCVCAYMCVCARAFVCIKVCIRYVCTCSHTFTFLTNTETFPLALPLISTILYKLASHSTLDRRSWSSR